MNIEDIRRAADTEAADSEQIADAVAATWENIESALSPIIGQRGVSALLTRSLHLTARTHPWLAATLDTPVAVNGATLKPLFAGQPRAVAAVAAALLTHTFHELLTTLIGQSLTGRLLRSVLPTPPTDAPAQDTYP